LISCGEIGGYQAFHSIENDNWNRNDTAHFVIDIKDTTSKYQWNYLLRHKVDYAYQNLWVTGKIVCPNDSIIPIHQNVKLGDKNGIWYGNGLSNIMNVEVPIQENFKFPHAGEYHFYLLQNMRENPIEGIIDFGIKIKKQ